MPKPPCSFPGCDRHAAAKSLCLGHWGQQYDGRALRPIRPMRRKGSRVPLCSFDGCSKPQIARKLCSGHHKQASLGKPLVSLNSRNRPYGTPPRIVVVEMPCSAWGIENGITTPCHIWKGRRRKRYPSVRFNGGIVKVSRYIWETTHGPIPDLRLVDHMCREPSCCNINHLRLVTHQVNSTENVVGHPWQLGKAKTHCPRGHAYTLDNTYVSKTGGRSCKECTKRRSRERRLQTEDFIK